MLCSLFDYVFVCFLYIRIIMIILILNIIIIIIINMSLSVVLIIHSEKTTQKGAVLIKQLYIQRITQIVPLHTW